MAKAPAKKALPARGTRTSKHNAISEPAMDKKWQAQDDLHHLKRAEEVKSDPSRLKAENEMTPSMTHWIDRVYFSVPHDCDVARISGFDSRACEHWMIVESGKGYRERRDEALIKIQESIEAGDPPGEVQ